MNYPWPLSTRTDVEVDADEILDYVRDNKEWFVEKLQNLSPEREVIKELSNRLQEILDKYDNIRILRDQSHSNETQSTVKLYNALVELKNYVDTQL